MKKSNNYKRNKTIPPQKNPKFAERIKKLMLERAINRLELARLMDCPPVTVSSWRSGTVPTMKNLKKLARTLDVSIAYLIDTDDDGIICSNSNEEKECCLRNSIEEHLKTILDEAEGLPGALEHMHIELLRIFPQKMYSQLLS